ncbi:GlxA family transcriptional regulator [Shimia thalassica]|uniref:GlxA family transcriptional regulator n=1 Tax=Shimia thalassica TaxID=1715693 RepID=UPI0026E2C152|nr:GlxA family transcriptional regulator [Shimia thalassica]MDO6480048.1 GlxA family transcriptional regulator [Shimia thalassica]
MTNGLIPKGVAHVELETTPDPEHFVFLLLPNMSMLAFSAAIEPLRIANQLTGKVLYRWTTMSEDGASVRASNGIEIGVDSPIGETKPGSYVFVCSGVEPDKATTKSAADWIRYQWRTGRVVGGLCTGAYALARAGILGGKEFTLHWENQLPFRESHPDLNVQEQLYVVDGRIMTCGGGAAATDLFLKLIYEKHGPMLSQAVLNMCLHFVHRSDGDSQTSSKSASLGIRNKKLLQIINLFDEEIEQQVDLDEIAYRVGVSRRQMERLFSHHIGRTPKRYLMDLRLQRARALMAETDLPVSEVAFACGFESTSHFSKRFRERFGVSPYSFSVSTS